MRPGLVAEIMTLSQADVLDFWFEGDCAVPRKKWFAKNPEFDIACARFIHSVREARGGRFDHWARTPKGALALIILLDQLPRNIFRASAEAYASDRHAREIARHAISAGFDAALSPFERQFIYLPFQHSEAMEDQNESVALYESQCAAFGADTVAYAHRHRDVIREFGRFPHRNAALGRTGTPEEAAWLSRPGSGF